MGIYFEVRTCIVKKKRPGMLFPSHKTMFRKNSCIQRCVMKAAGGLKKRLLWLYFKITREKASPEYVARGWAIGMFYGCFIPFGFQLICSIPTAFFLKGSKIGASLGTLLTNPVTILFIYPAQCWVGSRLTGNHLSYKVITESMEKVINHSGPWYEGYTALAEQGLQIVISFFTGGALLALIMTPVTYFTVLGIIRKYRAVREKRLAKKSALNADRNTLR